jgi:pseudouridine-5'-phosphate glycosidase
VTLDQSGSKTFPAFFTSSSGYEAAYNCRNEQQVAQLIQTNSLTGLGSGLLIGVPIPSEYSLNPESIEHTIQEALSELKRKNVTGKQITPFLLEKINQLTRGTSLRSNTALIKNNAMHSARIAVELSKLRKRVSQPPSCGVVSSPKSADVGKKVSVIGGINLDSKSIFVTAFEHDI